jgi:hypothetical protein
VKLSETVSGDVFYLADDPAVVLWNAGLYGYGEQEQEHYYIQFWDECRYTAADIGDGTPEQEVVVIHNTEKGIK